MNQEIRDLALEAIVENISADRWVFNDQELEKFALSIEQAFVKRLLTKTSTSNQNSGVKEST